VGFWVLKKLKLVWLGFFKCHRITVKIVMDVCNYQDVSRYTRIVRHLHCHVLSHHTTSRHTSSLYMVYTTTKCQSRSNAKPTLLSLSAFQRILSMESTVSNHSAQWIETSHFLSGSATSMNLSTELHKVGSQHLLWQHTMKELNSMTGTAQSQCRNVAHCLQ